MAYSKHENEQNPASPPSDLLRAFRLPRTSEFLCATRSIASPRASYQPKLDLEGLPMNLSTFFRATVLLLVALPCCSLRASELLSAAAVFSGGGYAPCSEIGPVEFMIGHDPDPYVPPYSPVEYGRGLRLWNEGDSGHFDITPGNEPRFADLAAVLTDGDVDMIWFLNVMDTRDPIGVGGSGRPESAFCPSAGDLAGNQLDFVRLYVSNVDIEILDPQTRWVAWTADVTYEFWGTPLPEPATILLLVMTSLLRSRNHRVRSLRRPNPSLRHSRWRPRRRPPRPLHKHPRAPLPRRLFVIALNTHNTKPRIE